MPPLQQSAKLSRRLEYRHQPLQPLPTPQCSPAQPLVRQQRQEPQHPRQRPIPQYCLDPHQEHRRQECQWQEYQQRREHWHQHPRLQPTLTYYPARQPERRGLSPLR